MITECLPLCIIPKCMLVRDLQCWRTGPLSSSPWMPLLCREPIKLSPPPKNIKEVKVEHSQQIETDSHADTLWSREGCSLQLTHSACLSVAFFWGWFQHALIERDTENRVPRAYWALSLLTTHKGASFSKVHMTQWSAGPGIKMPTLHF